MARGTGVTERIICPGEEPCHRRGGSVIGQENFVGEVLWQIPGFCFCPDLGQNAIRLDEFHQPIDRKGDAEIPYMPIHNEGLQQELGHVTEPDELARIMAMFEHGDPIMHDIAYNLIIGNHHEVDRLTKEALDNGYSANTLLDDGLISAMAIVGVKFRDNVIFVPEVLIAARAMKAGMVHVEPILSASGIEPIGTVVMGTVKGDLHDIGKNLVLMLFTDNLLGSMVEINLLPVIVFSIVFAGMLTTMGKRSEAIANLVLSINHALLGFILLLMRVAPIGIFCLVAARFGKAQADGKFLELLQVQSYYMVTVLTGLTLHALVTLPLLLYIFTRRNPFVFMKQMSQAVLTAFSTASSTATLPVTMECAETKAGVSKRSTEFVLPLGATINMDGTALYEAAAAIFIAQAYVVIDPSYQLDLLGQLTIAVTATLAAIGAAGIPEAGLVTMLIVLNAVGLPLEMIGLIIPVDWLLDRFRTAVNVFGDSVGSAIVDKSFKAQDA